MHLWAGNGKVNGTYHKNYYYGYVDKSRSYDNAGSDYSYLSGNLKGYSATLGGTVTVFEPQDSDKGDIARAIFYMAARYNYLSGSDSDGIDASNPNLELVNNVTTWSNNGYTSSTSTTGKMGVISDLLKWNRIDPPDEWEIHRNDLLYTNFTNNRNPFIDFPDWAEYIWGDKSGVSYANPSSDTIHAFSSGGGSPQPQQDVEVTGVSLISSASVKEGESIVLSPDITPFNATNKNVTWHTDDASIATVDNGRVTGISTGTVDISVVTNDGQYEATCSVEVKAASDIDVESDTITKDSFDVSGQGYSPWESDVVGASGAVFSGVTTSNSNYIQLNNKSDRGAGIVSTSSNRNLKRVSVEWGGGNTSGRYISIYGKNEAFTGPSELYNDETKGTLLGKITFGNDNPLYLDINNNYKYVGIVASNALYLSSITFDWDIPVSSVELDEDSVQLDLNGDDVTTLNATILPKNATNQNISWSSSDNSVATVENGVVTALAVGETTVTITSEDGNKTATCEVTVIDSTPPETDEITIDTSILAVATENNWSNGVAYATSENGAANLDENIKFYTNGTNNNGKYYTSDKTWRLYNSGSGDINIKASDGSTIKSITLTFSVGDSGILLNPESSVVVTGEPYECDTQLARFTVSSGKVFIKNISVTYETSGQAPTKELSSISISDYKTKFTVDDGFTFGGIVTAHFDDETTQNVTGYASFNGYDMSITGTQTVTVSYTYKEIIKTATYQITVESKSYSPYVNGVKYKLFLTNANNSTDYYFTGSMSGYYGATNSNYANGVYVYFEQNGDGQNLYFLDNEVKKYISIVLNGTYYNFTISENVPSTAWHYSNLYECIYYVVNERNYTIGTYGSYNTFYTFNLESYPTNYKPKFKDTAETFSYDILNMITCDPNGVNSPIYRSGYSWSDLKVIYNGLDTSEQEILQTAEADVDGSLIEQALAKYEYIAGKYKLDNFIANRTPKSFPYRYTPDIIEKNYAAISIIAVMLSSLTVIGLYCFIAKKRHK